MKKLLRLGLASSLVLFCLLIIHSCQKEKNATAPIAEGQQRLRIYLTDNPVRYDAVYVDIQQVIIQVIPDSCQGRDDNNNDCFDDNEFRCSVWDTLAIRPGVYNLLNLSNGTDTLLANGLTLAGRVNKIKLVLGNNNSVVIDSVSYPLTLHNNNHSIVLQVKGADIDAISSNDLQLWLDFDAGGSIVKVSNNRFVLKPKIKIFVPDLTAGIRGKVLPGQANAVVSAITAGDTLIAIPDRRSGAFKIRGLSGSTANVFINATAGNYKDTALGSVALRAGKDTDVGTIQLHQ